jgi:hypothetical protein
MALGAARGYFRGMTTRSGKTAYPKIGVWFDEVRGDIHLNIAGHGLSTINADPSSKRGNPHLFNKLAKALRDEGRPHPEIIEDWKEGIRGQEL